MLPLRNAWLYESVSNILQEANPEYTFTDVVYLLEDTTSPVTQKLQSKLYNMVLNSGHIDFGDIPKSKGNISLYSGYEVLLKTLSTLMDFAVNENNTEVSKYCQTSLDMIDIVYSYKDLYMRGYQADVENVIVEYEILVYLLVQGCSSLLYTFIDFVKNPSLQTYNIKLKNTKVRADLFYINTLIKMKRIMSNKTEYRKYLEALLQPKDNFIGTSTLIGIGTVSAVAFAIVPLTREAIYQIFNLRSKLSEFLKQQSLFLEMNVSRVKANSNFDEIKRMKIAKKQDAVARQLMAISDKLKIENANASVARERNVKKDNKLLDIGKLKDEINSSPIELI